MKHIFTSGILAVAVMATTSPVYSYEIAPVTGGGSIEGTVTFQGNVPMKKIIPTKDVEVCGEPREDPLIRVGDGKGVESAVVYLVDVASGKAWPAPGKAPELNNKNCRFEPEVQVMAAGAIDIINLDPVLHNTHGYYGKRTAFNTALPNQNQRVQEELQRAGAVKVDCDAHGWMEGWVHVVDNPYYSLTGADGAFSITDVPPGDYKLVATHSFTGPMEIPVTVAAGQPTELDVELKK